MTVCGNSTTWALLPVATCAATHNSVTPHETNSFGHSLALESMMGAILHVNAMFLRSCFLFLLWWNLRCHTVLDARLVSKLQITPAKGGDLSTYQLMLILKFHHCSPGENSNVTFTNWRMSYKVLFSIFLYLDGYVQDGRNWDICYIWTLDWAPCEGEEINLDLRVIYSCINPRTCIITASCTGAWSRGVSTSSERHFWLLEQVNRKKYVVLTK